MHAKDRDVESQEPDSPEARERERVRERIRRRREGGADPARWAGYDASAPSLSDRFRDGLRRHAFSIALVAALLLLGAALYALQPGRETPWESLGIGSLSGMEETRSGPGLSPYDGQATVSITSEPEGALVVINTDTLGATPIEQASYVAGAHLITLHSATARMDSVVMLRSDRQLSLHIRLDDTPLATAGNAGEQRAPPSDGPADLPDPAAPDEAAEATAGTRTAEDGMDRVTREYWRFRRYGEANRERGELREARRYFDIALDYRPGDAAAQAALDQLDERILQHELDSVYTYHRQRGDRLLQQDRYGSARIAYEEALRVRPGDRAVSSLVEQIDRMLAESSEQRQQYQYHRGRGDVFFEQEEYEAAAQSYQQALDYRPGDPYVRQRLAQSRARMGVRPDSATQVVPQEVPDDSAAGGMGPRPDEDERRGASGP